MKSRQVNFRCPEEYAKLFEAAAKRAGGMSLTQWLIQVGLHAAGHTELLEQLQRAAKPKKKR